jgi:2-methylcitrate dehydratase PrpD
MHRHEAQGEVFNAPSTEEITTAALAERGRSISGSDSPIVKIPYEQAYDAGFEDMPRRVPDTSKLFALTGRRPETSLDGKHGLFRQFTGDEAAAGRFRGLIGDLGRKWHLPSAAYKFYPCCHYLHPFIEAAGQLAERGVRPADVERIVCRVPQGEAAVICEPWQAKQTPATGHAARWSLPIAVAAQLEEGKVDLATFEAPASAAVRALAQRIAWEPLPGARFPDRFEAELSYETKAGKSDTVRIDDVFGNHTRPPGEDAVLAKFRANDARSLRVDAVAALERAERELGASRDLRALSAALRQTN